MTRAPTSLNMSLSGNEVEETIERDAQTTANKINYKRR